MKVANAQLYVKSIDGHPGGRRILVASDLEVPANDPTIGETLSEHATVPARNER